VVVQREGVVKVSYSVGGSPGLGWCVATEDGGVGFCASIKDAREYGKEKALQGRRVYIYARKEVYQPAVEWLQNEAQEDPDEV
jgi:D-serine dehydratase